MRYQDRLFQQRHDAILAAARQLFREQPWDRVTIAEVALGAGIGKGTVYKHFPSKEALYAQLVLELSRANLDELRALHAAQPGPQAMRQVIRRAFAQMLADPVLVQLCLLCDRPAFQERLEMPYREQFLALEHDYQALFGQLLADCLDARSLPHADCQHLLWGVEACFSGVMARIASGGFAHWAEPIGLPDYFERVTDFIIAGLKGQAASLRGYRLNIE
ncbi:helix-turn-helix domain-containing protein [Pseudomonas benzenivorans]|uniref:Helix-turn-helix domain-containing protein n=1 Tax=Pseudomonas benzenivorans TaxID=556533 RepID=A0ABZ0PYW3_9PSED|nr:helix-turn-helix domain-containing protein [Pseudomonas benzenivorans]WPC06331.1 helix-turn-helix domain-containing protein [Pseudomonas benzenivorans]